MSARRRAGPQTLRCPVCETTVRADRLASHVRAVHPREQGNRSVQQALQNAPASTAGTVPHRLKGTPWWTRGRVVGITIAVAIVVLVAYALVRAPPTSVRNGAAAPDFTFTDAQ